MRYHFESLRTRLQFAHILPLDSFPRHPCVVAPNPNGLVAGLIPLQMKTKKSTSSHAARERRARENSSGSHAAQRELRNLLVVTRRMPCCHLKPTLRQLVLRRLSIVREDNGSGVSANLELVLWRGDDKTWDQPASHLLRLLRLPRRCLLLKQWPLQWIHGASCLAEATSSGSAHPTCRAEATSFGDAQRTCSSERTYSVGA